MGSSGRCSVCGISASLLHEFCYPEDADPNYGYGARTGRVIGCGRHGGLYVPAEEVCRGVCTYCYRVAYRAALDALAKIHYLED